MIWDVAAGTIIGGGALALVVLGIRETALAAQAHDGEASGFGLLMGAAGIALGAWVIFFKAHF
jgi:hypothetical protein